MVGLILVLVHINIVIVGCLCVKLIKTYIKYLLVLCDYQGG